MKKTIPIILLLIAISCTKTPTKPNACAQSLACPNSIKATGILKNMTGFDGCGWIIQLNDTTKLEPTNLSGFNLTLVDGNSITFCYKETNQASICMVGKTIEIVDIACLDTNHVGSICDVTDIVCTTEFRTVSIKVNYLSVPPTSTDIDKFYTKIKQTGAVVFNSNNATATDWSLWKQYGYPIISDAQMQAIDYSGTIFTFYAEHNGVVKIQEDFIVGKDCCHINKISGKDEVNIP